MMRPITLTMLDGAVLDAMLLSPAPDTGEGASLNLAVPCDRGDGWRAPIAVVPGADADNWTEAE